MTIRVMNIDVKSRLRRTYEVDLEAYPPVAWLVLPSRRRLIRSGSPLWHRAVVAAKLCRETTPEKR